MELNEAKQDLEDFANDASIQGLRPILFFKSTAVKLFWIFAFICQLALSVYQCTGAVQRLLAQQVTVKIQVTFMLYA